MALLQSKRAFDNKTNHLGALMEEVVSSLRAAREGTTTNSSTTSVYSVDAVGSNMLQAIVDAAKKKSELEQATLVMSPSTRAVVLGGIEREIAALGRQYKDHLEKGTNNNDERRRLPAADDERRQLPAPRRLTTDLDVSSTTPPPSPRRTLEERRRDFQLDPSSDEEEEHEPHPDDSPRDNRPRR